MSVLVTGASGFVGSWLVRRLAEQGETVHVLHRPNSRLEDLKGLSFVSRLGDVTDPKSVDEAVAQVDVVYHLAGVVGYSPAMREQMERVNIGGTRNVISAAERSPRRPAIVYMSSVVAVGASFTKTLLNEESPYSIGQLRLGYFDSKHEAELLMLDACRAGRIHAVILNPSTIYGPADARKGSRKMQVKVARGEFPFYTSGGISVVSIHDVIDATLNALNKGRRGERYILSGENLTIKDLFQRLAHLGGQKPPWIYLPSPVVHSIGRLGDVLEKMGRKGPLTSENAWTSLLFHWFDHSKAQRELGFNPRPADFALKESVDWMKQKGMLK